MPDISSIRTSIENQNILVLDDHARKGKFSRDKRGRLMAYTGGFTVVFPYTSDNSEQWSFRCWHSNIDTSKRRYEIIAKTIRSTNLPFLSDFVYTEKGIKVDDAVYPTTRMRWIDGIPIKDYICQNRSSKKVLNQLAEDFLSLSRKLHKLSIAHGDLQHGNILISNDRSLHLIDYDSFYCNDLQGEYDRIAGIPDYQHPARRNNRFLSEKVDYFSELVIYLSILAIAENPLLIDKYNVDTADRLLFSREDFSDIKNSAIYDDISKLGDSFRGLLDILEIYLSCEDINELQPLEYYLLLQSVTFNSTTTKAIRDSQMVEITWNVPFSAKVQLSTTKSDDIRDCAKHGSISTSLHDDTTFMLIVKTDDGYTLNKKISIKVFDECKIEFVADKCGFESFRANKGNNLYIICRGCVWS